MTQEKTRLKFRVSAHDGVTAGGLPEPRWTEKWGVGLFDYEEFHVTDQLLKLPFQEATPKTVCVFSISEGALAFRLLDADRRAEVNGVERKDAIITTGDQIKIGETLLIEVVFAPPKSVTRVPAAGPSIAASPDVAKPDPEEGPTLTFSPTGSHENYRPEMVATLQKAKAAAAAELAAMKGPDLSSEPKGVDYGAAAIAGPTIPPPPVFQEVSKSVEINEPSFNALRGGARTKKETTAIPPRPAGPMRGMEPEGKVELMDRRKPGVIPPRPASLSGSAGPMPGMIPEDKVELADGKFPGAIPRRPASLSAGPMRGMEPEGKVELMDVPHAERDRSLDDRMDAMAELTDESIKPFYAEEADLSAKPTLGERILAAISRILRRDDIQPPEEPFSVDDYVPAKPWIPEGTADPGISRSRDVRESREKAAEPDAPKSEAKPWIPEFISAASRIRGRALIFLVAAIGTLMIAVGVFRIHYRIALMHTDRPEETHRDAEFGLSRGIPIEIIEDKVRRMRTRGR